MTETFSYQGHIVHIVKDTKHLKPRYWFVVDERPIAFVSKPDTAKRLATKFIDVITDSHFKTSLKIDTYPKQFSLV